MSYKHLKEKKSINKLSKRLKKYILTLIPRKPYEYSVVISFEKIKL